ncbi:MAG: hypothetical protein RLZZ308_583 [Candidatus Parcubacteria bacterium]
MNGITQVIPATAGQLKQINRIIADAVEKIVTELGLDKDGAQRVIEHGDELVGNIGEVAMATLKDLSVTDKYKDEEVKSNYGYLSGYKKPKGITEQTNILRQLFPGIGFADEKLAEREVPNGADKGWFAIPKWQSLAPTYGEAVQLVLNKLKETRSGAFYNYREGELGPDQLRQSAKTVSVFQKLAEEQNGFDVLVVAAQFGLRHRGRSVRRVREILLGNEFGLGAFAVGIMLLTHPERLAHYDDLWIDCAGDEFAPGADGKFWYAPIFGFDDGRLEFPASDVSDADGYYGSVSGFLPL